jgi:hypothetical protein
MFNRTLKHSVAAVAAAAGLLAAAGPASAILYDGHAGLGSSAYQHNQTDLEYAFSPQGPTSDGFWLGSSDALGVADASFADGTSNTLQAGLRAGR